MKPSPALILSPRYNEGRSSYLIVTSTRYLFPFVNPHALEGTVDVDIKLICIT